MNAPAIKILLHEDGQPLEDCLRGLEEPASPLAIDLYCLHSGPPEGLQKICARLRDAGAIASFSLIQGDSQEWPAVANSLFAHSDAGFLFFLASSVHMGRDVLAGLAARLGADAETAGLNPLLLAGWVGGRVAHLGTVCDCQHYLHYLYEGLEAENPLAQKTRFFQLAHPGACLLRASDFAKTGGFADLPPCLAWPDFCARLRASRGKGFSTAPALRAILLNRFDSWEFCGAWNSALQTGRLVPDAIEPDYPFLAQADGLEYKIDPWLWEQAPSSAPDAWTDFRRSPNPATLLKYLASLPEEARAFAFRLATTLPATLPQSFAFYTAQCAKIEAFARKSGLEGLAAQTRDWTKRSARFHHGLLRPGIALLQKSGLYDCSLDWSRAVYPAWIEIGEKFERLEPGASWPEIAVLLPVYNPRPQFLLAAINSVRAQTYANWQLCIADDASTDPAIAEMLRSLSDKRIRLRFRQQNGHICRASNSALELVNAPYTAFLDHDDMLAPQALELVARSFAHNSRLGYIYTDMDRIDENNVRSNPLFKPDFDCDLFYTGHLSTYATDLVRGSGGLREGMEGSQDFDLCLRVTEKLAPGQIAHIPRILYHWRVHENSTSTTLAAKPYVLEATKRAWLDHAERLGRPSQIAEAGKNNFFILAEEVPPNISCALVLLRDASAPQAGSALAAQIASLRQSMDCAEYALPIDGQGGVVRAMREAADMAREAVLLFLYAGIAPREGSRLEQLVLAAARDDLAMAGGLAWHGGRLANGGWYPDASGLPFRLLRGAAKKDLTHFAWGQFLLPRHTIGLSWQCLAMKRESAANLRESFGPLALVDAALAEMLAGRHTLASPWAQWECPREDKEPQSGELERLREKWGDAIRACPLRNPNLRAAPDSDWTLIF